MKRFTALFYYFLLLIVPFLALVTVFGVKTERVSGDVSPTPKPDYRTVCHWQNPNELGGEYYHQIDVDMNFPVSADRWYEHCDEQGNPISEHEKDICKFEKNYTCNGESPIPTGQPSTTPMPSGSPTPSTTPVQTPTPSVSLTPLPTQTPIPTQTHVPTITPEPTQPPLATVTSKPEESKKKMDISKSGPTCEQRTFPVSVQLKDDGREIKDVIVTFDYLGKVKKATTDDQGKAGVDFDYAGKGDVASMAENWPTARVYVDELICDGTVLGASNAGNAGAGGVGANGKILGYASTGMHTDVMILVIQSVGLLLMTTGVLAFARVQ